MLALPMWLEVCSRNATSITEAAGWEGGSSEIFLMRAGCCAAFKWDGNTMDAWPGQLWRSNPKHTALGHLVIPLWNTCSTQGSQLHLIVISPRAYPHCCFFLIRAELHPSPLYCQVGGSCYFATAVGKPIRDLRWKSHPLLCLCLTSNRVIQQHSSEARRGAKQVLACFFISFFLSPFSWKLNCQD